MFLAEQVRSTLRRASIQKLELLSSEYTHFEYRNDFIEIVILCLLLSYLVYNTASAPEADYQTWTQFLAEFAAQFQDSMKEERAQIELENLHMRFPDIDQFISMFEELSRQAGYLAGNAETYKMFLNGISKFLLEPILVPPRPTTYQALEERAIDVTRTKQLMQAIQGPNRGRGQLPRAFQSSQ